jgi:hypothetical protein
MNDEKINGINKTYTAGDVTNANLLQGENITSNITNSFTSHDTDKTLIDTATEIQTLLEQLSQRYPNQTTTQQMQIATKAIERIENNNNWKQRSIKAFQTGLLESLKTNPVGAFVVGAIQGWSQDSKNP